MGLQPCSSPEAPARLLLGGMSSGKVEEKGEGVIKEDRWVRWWPGEDEVVAL